MTPEGKVKKAIKKAVENFKSAYVFMSVPGGYGPSTLDYLICYGGRFIAVEAKAPGKKPTPRQKKIMADIIRAGGDVLVIDNHEGVQRLEALLEKIRKDAG